MLQVSDAEYKKEQLSAFVKKPPTALQRRRERSQSPSLGAHAQAAGASEHEVPPRRHAVPMEVCSHE